MTKNPHSHPTASLLPRDLQIRLKRVTFRHYVLGVGTGVSRLLATICSLLVFQCLADWWFELPFLARLFFAIGDLVAIAAIFRFYLLGPLRKSLSRSESALLIERTYPHLQQSLVSAVQFAEGGPRSTANSPQLLNMLLARAYATTIKLDLKKVVPLKDLYRWIAIAVTVFIASAGLSIYGGPSSVTLLERVFLFNVTLPTKTQVVAITRDLVVPVGSDVEISAHAVGVIPPTGRVSLSYNGLTAQDALIRPSTDKPTVFSYTIHNIQNPLSYTFFLNDGHGETFSITPKTPPEISGITCEQAFPAYTKLPDRVLASSDLSLLIGSHLQIKAHSTLPLKSASIIVKGTTTQTIEATVLPSSNEVTADIPINDKDMTGFAVHLVDASGFPSVNETTYPVTPIPDNPPNIAVTDPTEDHQTITVQATPAIDFTASDDYGIASLVLKYRISLPAIAGQTTPEGKVESVSIPLHSADKPYECLLNSPKNPAFQEGATVTAWIEATDNNTVSGPGVTKSDEIQYTIVSQQDKQAEIIERLKQKASDIENLSNAQQKLNDDLHETVPNQ